MPRDNELALLLRAIRSPGDESPDDALLLLWFLRNVMVVDELDAYEFVVQDAPGPIDGFYLQPSFDSEAAPTLFVFEAKVQATSHRVSRDAVERFAATLTRLSIEGFGSTESAELRVAGLRENLDKRLLNKDLVVQPVLVVAGTLTPSALELAREHKMLVYDLQWLANLARSLEGPALLDAVVTVSTPADRRFITETTAGKLAVAEVKASEIANWPGIEDRSLFGLNVRGELGQNRVRTELNAALQHPEDYGNFLAYHNGMTVICSVIEETPAGLTIRGMSVVNGAQSVLAFNRARDVLRDDARILVKFVEASAEDRAFATEVARRSNTQTAVNPRNLRANDSRQRAIAAEFERDYPNYAYIVKPDATVQPTGTHINNDDAAQLLCSLYNERPWLAVKRLNLFRPPNYTLIFGPQITASHIVLAHRLRERIQTLRGEFPEVYRTSWRLTAVMTVYLAGQLMRQHDDTRAWLENPANVANANGGVEARLDEIVRGVADTFHEWHQERISEFGFDDFKVDFKRENTARALAEYLRRPAPTFG